MRSGCRAAIRTVVPEGYRLQVPLNGRANGVLDDPWRWIPPRFFETQDGLADRVECQLRGQACRGCKALELSS